MHLARARLGALARRGAAARRRSRATSPRWPRASHLDDGSGLDVTEAGTKKSLAIYVVRDAAGHPRRRQPRPRPARRRVHDRRALGDPAEGRPRADQGGAARTRAPSPASATPTPTSCCTRRRCPRSSPRRQHRSATSSRPCTTRSAPCSATRWPGRGAARRRPQGREEEQPVGARADRHALPGVRRHRARGVVRRLLAAVLPDLPDRRQAAGRPADVPAAQVAFEP